MLCFTKVDKQADKKLLQNTSGINYLNFTVKLYIT